MNINLPIDVYSPDQLSQLLLELQNFSGALRDASVRAKSRGSNIELPDLPQNLQNLLKATNVNSEDSSALEELNQELKKLLNSSPTVHLILAANPAKTLKRQLTMWFRTEIHPNILLTFAVRSDIGGGVIVRAGSNLYDLSFRRSILANKNRLSEIAGV